MGGRVRPGCILLLLLSLLFVTPKGYAQEPLPAIGQPIKGSDLELLLKTLENSSERDKLIKQLKSLIALQKKQKKKSKIFSWEKRLKIKKALKELEALPVQLKEYTRTIPGYFSASKQYLSKKENIFLSLNMAIKFLLSGLLGWVVFYYLRKYLWRFKQPQELKEEMSRGKELRIVSVSVGIDIIPFLSLLFIWLLFAIVVGLGIQLRNCIALIILLILTAKALSDIAEKLLAPNDPAQRLIPCADALAVYFSLWFKRFIYYAVYGYLPLAIGTQLGFADAVLSVLRDIYKLVLIGLAAIFVLQWKDSIKERLSMKEQDRTAKQFLARIYNLILGKLYILLILYFFVLLTIAILGYTGTALQMIFKMIGSLLIIGLGVGIWELVRFSFNKLAFLSDRVKDRFPGLEITVNKHLSFARIGINIFLFSMISILVFGIWGLNLTGFIVAGIGGVIIKRLVFIAITLGLALLIIDASQYSIQRVLMEKAGDEDKGIELSRRVKTFLPLCNNLVKYVTFFIAGMIILGQLGIDITPILAGAGVVGLAVGFGAQSLVKDVISGFFILFEDLISVGDVVVVKGTGGVVEEVNLRTVRLRDLSGNVHVIPNSSIDMITNMTKEYSCYVLDLGVSYREDVDEVIQVVKEIGEELQADPYYGQNILDPLEVLGVDNFGESEVTIKFRIKTKTIKQWEVGRELRRRIKKAFDAKGIEMPFPHRTIYFGSTPPVSFGPEASSESAGQEDKNPEDADTKGDS